MDFDFEQKCYGCGACAYVCPTGAIEMKPDFEGFVMPQLNTERCIDCGKCENKCAYLNPVKGLRTLSKSICKAAFRKDVSKLLKSASGGAAAVITESFIKQRGVVVGCAWSEDLKAEHVAVDKIEDAYRLQSSKYVQSDMLKSYELIRIALLENKKVLFIGTPCQTGAIRNIFGYDDNLLLIGLICGGVSSPKVWQAFKNDAEKKYGAKMISADFRSKGRYGWNTPVARYEFENGKKSEKLSFQLDDYVLQYLYGVFKRNSCYQCIYKGDTINADIVLGDYWGSSEFRDRSENKGVSAILCLTAAGEECLKSVQGEFEIIDTTLDSILHKNQPLIKSVGRGGDRKSFFEALDKMGYYKVAKKFGGKINPIKYMGMWFLDKTGLFELVKRMIKG